MKLTLSKRIIGAVIISVLVGSTSAIISSFSLMRGFDEHAQKDVEQYSIELAAQADQMKVMVNELFKLIGGNAGLKHAQPAFTKAAQRRITDSCAVFQHPVCALQPDDAWRASALVR